MPACNAVCKLYMHVHSISQPQSYERVAFISMHDLLSAVLRAAGPPEGLDLGRDHMMNHMIIHGA